MKSKKKQFENENPDDKKEKTDEKDKKRSINEVLMDRRKEKATEGEKKKEKAEEKRKSTRKKKKREKRLTQTQKDTYTHTQEKSRDQLKRSKLAEKPCFKSKKHKANPELSSGQMNKINSYFMRIGTESERVQRIRESSAGEPSNNKYIHNLNLSLTQGQVDKTRDRERPALARTRGEIFSSNLTSNA